MWHKRFIWSDGVQKILCFRSRLQIANEEKVVWNEY